MRIYSYTRYTDVLYFYCSDRRRVFYHKLPRIHFLDFVPGAKRFSRSYIFHSIFYREVWGHTIHAFVSDDSLRAYRHLLRISYTKRIQEKTIACAHPRPLTRYSSCCGLNRALLSAEIIVLAPPPCVGTEHDFFLPYYQCLWSVRELMRECLFCACRTYEGIRAYRIWSKISPSPEYMFHTGGCLSSIQHSSRYYFIRTYYMSIAMNNLLPKDLVLERTRCEWGSCPIYVSRSRYYHLQCTRNSILRILLAYVDDRWFNYRVYYTRAA